MFRSKIVKKILLASVFFLTFASCGMVKETEESVNKEVLVTYTNKEITRGEVEDYYKGFEDLLKQKYGEDFKNNKEYINQELKSFAENYGKQELLKSEFMEKKLLSEKEIEEQVEEIVDSILHQYVLPEGEETSSSTNKSMTDSHGHKVDEETLNKDIKNSGLVDLDDFKQKQRDKIMIDSLYENIIKDIDVSDDEISNYYDANKEVEYATQPGAEMFHILVDTEEEALKVKERLENGEKYEDLAKELNEDATSQTGGSLGFVEYDSKNYDQDFLAGAKNLEEGEISDPVKTQFGYHIIKVENINQEVEYEDLETVKLDVEKQVLQKKQQEMLEKFTQELFKEKNFKLKE